jgi:hypothetical protein
MRRAEAPACRLQCEREDAYEGDSDPTPVDRVYAMLLAFDLSVLIDLALCKADHDSRKHFFEVNGYASDVDLGGWPVDKMHRCYRT